MTTILQGVVGSTAYGIAGPDSDTDRLAVHLGPIDDILAFGLTQETIVRRQPDFTSHEVAKFLTLVLKGNPTVTELLWLDEYEVVAPQGEALKKIRRHLLGADSVRAAYGGYAMQQITRLLKRGDSFSSETKRRKGKHARHCLRLLLQGTQILREGKLTVALDDGQKAVLSYATDLAEHDDHDNLNKLYERFDAVLQRAYDRSTLPATPNREMAANLLRQIRQEQIL